VSELLNLAIFLPLLGAAVVAVLPDPGGARSRWVALGATLGTLVLAVVLWTAFDPSPSAPEFQFQTRLAWIPSLGIGYLVGVDGVALLLIALTALLSPLVILSTWRAEKRVKELMVALLALETAMLGAFVALDLVLFYVFWEAMLIPMYLIIGVWGSENRIYATVKFFIYTFAASALMLVAILYVYFQVGRTFDYLAARDALTVGESAGRWLFLAFAVAFAVKVPMFPFHTWLPDAHTEAPTAGSVVLAGVLLKMGTFGFFRYAMPLFPEAASYFRPWIVALAVVGVLYGALMCLVQRDMKRLVAYSSVSHLGFVMLGLFALTAEGVTGSVYQMVNHGISTGALFLLVGMLYERRHTRLITEYGGIAKQVPWIAAAFVLVTLASIGVPGTNGFVGEFLILSGTWLGRGEGSAMLAALAAVGVILGAVYMLLLVERVFFGPIRVEANRNLPDLTGRESLLIAPLAILIVVMGVAPQPFLNPARPAVDRLLARFRDAGSVQPAAAVRRPILRPRPSSVPPRDQVVPPGLPYEVPPEAAPVAPPGGNH
jgi:NADH-quinone oxidoreductase subunit M